MDAEHRAKDDRLRAGGTRSGFAAAVVLYGIAKGVPREQMQAAIGIGLDELVDPENRVPDDVIGAAWREIARHFPGSPVGLELAAAVPTTAFGPLAQVLSFVPSRREGLESVARYHKVLSGGLAIRVFDDGAHTVVESSHTQDAVDGGHGAEAALGMIARMSQQVLGVPAGNDGSIVAIELEHRARQHDDPAKFAAWFEAPVHFEASRNAVVFERAALEPPPARPDSTMVRFITAHLDQVEARLLEQIVQSPLDRVREAIAAQARQSKFAAEDVAAAMGMSVRTLQRHVRKHGHALRELIEQAREAAARRLLSDERLSVEEVAFLVGYSDDRAFRRAFTRWTGHSPAAFRSKVSGL